MDEKQLQYEFLSILSESHPGLTFEEYRDSCVFLLFYQYLCLKHGDSLEEAYKPGELVKMAIRGKLQVASFLKFMESASSFLHLLNKDFQLTEFSFYKSLERVHSLEKQKSYARFFRKFLKKIDGWDCKEELLRQYPKLFILLIAEFAKLKTPIYSIGAIYTSKITISFCSLQYIQSNNFSFFLSVLFRRLFHQHSPYILIVPYFFVQNYKRPH